MVHSCWSSQWFARNIAVFRVLDVGVSPVRDALSQCLARDPTVSNGPLLTYP